MATVVIFDSGVGGLSIYRAIHQKLPGQRYVFVSDNQAYPYGTKSEEELRSRVLPVVSRVVDQFQPDILVIACNTASTVLLPQLRQAHDVPIVGVVPAVKPAARRSASRVIGLLATPATIKRQYTRKLISDFAANCRVINVGSSALVDIAEKKLRGEQLDMHTLEIILKPILDEPKCDVLVLACTHFPLLNREIKAVFSANNHPIELLDSGAGIANRVAQLLVDADEPGVTEGANAAIFTRKLDKKSRLDDTLRQLGFADMALLK